MTHECKVSQKPANRHEQRWNILFTLDDHLHDSRCQEVYALLEAELDAEMAVEGRIRSCSVSEAIGMGDQQRQIVQRQIVQQQQIIAQRRRVPTKAKTPTEASEAAATLLAYVVAFAFGGLCAAGSYALVTGVLS